MSAVRHESAGRVLVLLEDPDLADAVAPDRRERAIDECTASELRLPTGSWEAANSTELHGGIGLLVLEGLLIRRVGFDGRFGAELLGEGDVLRPWQEEFEQTSMLPIRSDWTVLGPARAAVLDQRFAQHFVRYPGLAEQLFARAIDRSRHLAVQLAIICQARVEVRLHMLFWYLASRWGRVRSDGTAVPLRLTHTLLAELVGVRRPAVTSTLADLNRRGLVRFVDDVWLLTGDPPGALLIVRELLLGPKRFTDLRAGLPNLSANVLSQRLRELEQYGIVRRGKLPPPAGSQIYELTERGQGLEPVVLALGRWGSCAPFPPGDRGLGVDATVIALKTLFDPSLADGGADGRYALRLGDQRFSAWRAARTRPRRGERAGREHRERSADAHTGALTWTHADRGAAIRGPEDRWGQGGRGAVHGAIPPAAALVPRQESFALTGERKPSPVRTQARSCSSATASCRGGLRLT